MMHRRLNLGIWPTPLHRLERFSQRLGSELWIKRDDLTGFAGGGNKARKLEYLLFDALDQGAEAVVTHGAAQSNFIRQTAAGCRMLGLEFHAVAMEWPYPDENRRTRPSEWLRPQSPTGNLLLDSWLDAEVTILPDGDWETMERAASEIAEELRKLGKGVYQIPAGGSGGIGALGFVRAVEEVLGSGFERVIVASGSGSTQAGLAYGFARTGVATRVIGICTDDEPEMVEEFARIASELDELLMGNLNLAANDFDLRLDYAGGGYQVPTAECTAVIKLMAQTEGIFLDPVYTAKAFAGLMDMARKGELSGRTLFWHTGGFPGLFAHGYGP